MESDNMAPTSNLEIISSPQCQQRFQFKINYHTQMGEAVYVTGNLPELGEWDVRRSLRLSWNEVSL
jgi:hypothetical protein